MSNARTGIWSALGALVGGAIGAAGGRYAAQGRPRARYTSKRASGQEIEDAMVIGGAGGAVLGAFLAGAAAGESPAPQSAPPQLAGR